MSQRWAASTSVSEKLSTAKFGGVSSKKASPISTPVPPSPLTAWLTPAPTVNLNLLSHPSATKLDHPVRVTVAASAPSATLFEKMTAHNLLPVHVYGLTEVYGPSTKNYYLPSFHELPPEKKWSNMAKWQGHAFLGTREARVVKRNPKTKQGWEDVARDGKDVGEIVFRGNIVMKGYLNNEEGTKKAFEGGWFWSGDLAVIHPGGQIEIVDREKDIIISGNPLLRSCVFF